MPVKTYTAQSVGPNHDWDFVTDDQGAITALNIQGEVNYGEMGRTETINIWPALNQTQKDQLQVAYNQIAQYFRNQFVGQ